MSNLSDVDQVTSDLTPTAKMSEIYSNYCMSGRMRMMRVLRVMAAGLLIADALFTESPAAAGDREICNNSSGDGVIAACTRAIDSGQYTAQSVATLYISRGIEYGTKGQRDHAIHDFGQAIRLNPQFAGGGGTNPVSVGAGQFDFFCRAILVDCRTKASWAIKNIKGDAHCQHCIKTCWRKLRC